MPLTKRDRNILTAFWVVFIAMFFVWLLTGCATERKLNAKAARQANELIERRPLVVLPIFRGKFPCITTKLDTNIVWKDTVINIDCPELNQSASDYFTIRDTVKKTIRVPLQIREITKAVQDSSYGKEQGIRLDVMTGKVNTLQAEKDDLQSARNKWRLWFLILAGFNVVWFFGKPILRLLKIPI